MEEPLLGGYSPARDVDATVVARRGPALLGPQVGAVGQPSAKRLVAAPRLVTPRQRAPWPLDGGMGLLPQGAGGRHRRVSTHRLPAGLRVWDPASYARPGGPPSRRGDVRGQGAAPLPQRTYPHALARSRPGPPRVAQRASCHPDRRREGHALLRALGERGAPAGAHARAGAERGPTRGGAVDAPGEAPIDPRRRLPRARGAWATRPCRGDRGGAARRPSTREAARAHPGSARAPRGDDPVRLAHASGPAAREGR
jgi:hypothetical protein